jgi:tetratricopeptide (TPR) repeat protein
VEALERANELRPGDPKLMLTLGGAYHQAGDIAKARDMMGRFTSGFPNDPIGFFRMAQTDRALGNLDSERAALDRTLELDPNFHPALVVRFGVAPGAHDPAIEDELEKFGKLRKSWMAFVLASAVARERGDHAAAMRQAERALEIEPENEEALLHYTSALGGAKELGKLANVVRPAVESGKFSKRLDWNYAQVLRELGLTKDAVAVLRRAAENAPEDFRKMAGTMIDAWSGLVCGCGVRLEVNPAGLLARPILITLPDGDGGIVIDLGVQLPSNGAFPLRATSGQAFVTLQQGHSGSREPRPLGVFRVRGIAASPEAPVAIDCDIFAMPDGNLHFRARQGNRKLPVNWGQGAG